MSFCGSVQNRGDKVAQESIAVKMSMEVSGFIAGTDAAQKGLKGVTGAARPATAGLKNTSRGAREAGAGLKSAKDEARRTASGLSGVEKSASGAGNALGGLGKKLAGVVSVAAAVGGVKSILNLSDEMASIKARTDLMNDGLQSTGELQDAIFQSAQRARGAYQGTADAVAKMGILAKDAFSSNDETVAFMEQVNKQFAISGTSAEGRSAAMLQLTQAMGSGTLRGEELNSVLEQAPTIVQTIAKSLGVSTGELRNMAAEGKITSSVVKSSLLSAADETNAKFESMPMTFGQTLSSAKNIAVYGSQDIMQSINDVINGKDGGDIERSVQKMTDNFEDLFGGVERGVKRSGPAVKRMLKAVAGEVPRFTASAVKSMSAGLKDFTKGGVDIVLAIGDGIADELPSLIPAVTDGVMSAVRAIADKGPEIFACGKDVVIGLASGIKNQLTVMKETAGELVDGFFDQLNDPVELNKMIEGGISLAKSVADGIEDQGYAIANAGLHLADKLVEGIMTTNWIDVAKNIAKTIAENLTLNDVLGFVIPGYRAGNGVGRAVVDKVSEAQTQKSVEQAKKMASYAPRNNEFGKPLAGGIIAPELVTFPLNEKKKFEPGLASGGRVTTGGNVMVGERGPEVLKLPRGASVTPLEKVGKTTNNVNMVFNMYAGDKDTRRIATEIAREVKLVLGNM